MNLLGESSFARVRRRPPAARFEPMEGARLFGVATFGRAGNLAKCVVFLHCLLSLSLGNSLTAGSLAKLGGRH